MFRVTRYTRAGKTLYDKVFKDHVVDEENGNTLIYIDRHLIHEVTSPQAFEGLEMMGRDIRRKDLAMVTEDHNVSTAKNRLDGEIKNPESRQQCEALRENVKKHGLLFYDTRDARQGIVHVIGPEQGFTLPGMTVVCGDSHTSTHGAFGCLAFGIGTSEVEHVLATQTLPQAKAKNMKVSVEGPLPIGVTAKDVALHIIGRIGTAGGTGHVIEYCGSTITGLTMEGRMTLCNMAIEAGARAGMIAPDATTFNYVKDRPLSPTGTNWDNAVKYWTSLRSDSDAEYDTAIEIDAKDIEPQMTWGTSPEMVIPVGGNVPNPSDASSPERMSSIERALEYMGLKGGTPLNGLPIDKVFIGSCTNARIEDLRAAAEVAEGGQVASNVKVAMVVPGSGLVKEQAEREGLDKVFIDAGFDWREPGCSMCLAMNEDRLEPNERCVSTSNRNFEGRQGLKGRTHLASPAMAAAAAIKGHITDVRTLQKQRRSYSSPATPNAKAFVTHTGTAAPIPRINIDTDIIIPKNHLKTIKRTGLGIHAFEPIRYHIDEKTGERTPDESFILNNEHYKNASILVCGDNFGCGSSREHAPWALHDFGVRCVISTSFADIFFNNCFKNGILPLVLPPQDHSRLMKCVEDPSTATVTVDLPNQQITFGGETVAFDIDPNRKNHLVNGLDDIQLTLQKEAKIAAYEKMLQEERPWVFLKTTQA
eukprot:TRINITY_DN4922_c0_g1_i3.p1 TRINITY_DN4922_c0_g1~~TRINITY_DN4922_c0_g1_i3.p1  ORF type:complete len:703 (+),score=150.64 TRINITY_DN4922_c0_g1_i3:41-2149(+)